MYNDRSVDQSKKNQFENAFSINFGRYAIQMFVAAVSVPAIVPLYLFVVSDKNSPCCAGCVFAPPGLVCREAAHSACEGEATCNGATADCPKVTFTIFFGWLFTHRYLLRILRKLDNWYNFFFVKSMFMTQMYVLGKESNPQPCCVNHVYVTLFYSCRSLYQNLMQINAMNSIECFRITFKRDRFYCNIWRASQFSW